MKKCCAKRGFLQQQNFTNMPTNHIVIKGRVQGVFFRASAKEIADQLGLTGWVRNTEEGDVEALVTGTEDQVEKFITWCKKGPPRAVVTNVEVKDIPEENSFREFKVVRGW